MKTRILCYILVVQICFLVGCSSVDVLPSYSKKEVMALYKKVRSYDQWAHLVTIEKMKEATVPVNYTKQNRNKFPLRFPVFPRLYKDICGNKYLALYPYWKSELSKSHSLLRVSAINCTPVSKIFSKEHPIDAYWQARRYFRKVSKRRVILLTLVSGETLVLEKERIPKKNISFSVKKGVGCLTISGFSTGAYVQDIDSVFDYCRKNYIKKLIIDLRQNPGGSVYKTLYTADHFIPGRKVILQLEKKKFPRELSKMLGSWSHHFFCDSTEYFPSFLPYTLVFSSGDVFPKKYYSSSGGYCTDMDAIVLVDRVSCSGAEVLARVLQLQRGFYIYGTSETRGKNVGQRSIQLNPNYYLYVTSFEIQSPSGRKIYSDLGLKPLKYFKNDDACFYSALQDLLAR